MNQPRRPKRRVDGVLLLDKPYRITSNGALQKARWLYQAAKAGHTGVLDPLATGLLPICFGEATKFSSYLLDADKRYRATVRFGQVSTTGDSEGDIVLERPVTFIEADLRSVLDAFVGEIEQVPPMYSALKHQGRALYEYAREGVEIERQARRITIHSIDLVEFDGVSAVIDVSCSKGTYIRTLGQDIGEALGAGAHLTALRRLSTAGFPLEDSRTLEDVESLPLEQRDLLLLPVDVLVAHLPEVELGVDDYGRLSHGQPVRISENCETMSRFRVYHQETREFVGLAEARGDGMLHPVRLLSVAQDS
jgi:tRNA pseudouridine55 synthase